MRQRCSAAMATIAACLLAGGSPLAADEALRAHWTFDETGTSDSTPVFQATQEAIDATTVVWRSKIVGQPNSVTNVADSSGKANEARSHGRRS